VLHFFKKDFGGAGYGDTKGTRAILVFCKYRKEFDDKTLKAYRIDLRQYFEC